MFRNFAWNNSKFENSSALLTERKEQKNVVAVRDSEVLYISADVFKYHRGIESVDDLCTDSLYNTFRLP